MFLARTQAKIQASPPLPDESQDVKADRYLQRQHFTDGINQHLCLITLKDTFLTMDQRNLF